MAKMITGMMQPMVAKVNCHEMKNKRAKEAQINMKDRTNILTLVLSPSWMTVVSELSRDTKPIMS
jgi:hypothetical protein